MADDAEIKIVRLEEQIKSIRSDIGDQAREMEKQAANQRWVVVAIVGAVIARMMESFPWSGGGP